MVSVAQADSEDGLLLYCGENEHGRGDFTSLALVRGKLHYRWRKLVLEQGWKKEPSDYNIEGKRLKLSKFASTEEGCGTQSYLIPILFNATSWHLS